MVTIAQTRTWRWLSVSSFSDSDDDDDDEHEDSCLSDTDEHSSNMVLPLPLQRKGEEAKQDWKIQIYHQETGKVDRYLVHQTIVAKGPRRSDYLAALLGSVVVGHGSNSIYTRSSTNLERDKEEQKEHDKNPPHHHLSHHYEEQLQQDHLHQEVAAATRGPPSDGMEPSGRAPSSSSPSSSSPLPSFGILSLVELKEKQAQMVPSVLDFMYYGCYNYSEDPVENTNNTKEYGLLLHGGGGDDDDSVATTPQSNTNHRSETTFQAMYILAVLWKVRTLQTTLANVRHTRFTVETALATLKFALPLTSYFSSSGSSSRNSRSSSLSVKKQTKTFLLPSRTNNNNATTTTKTTTTKQLWLSIQDEPLLQSALHWCATNLSDIQPTISNSTLLAAGSSIEPLLLLFMIRQNLGREQQHGIDDRTRRMVVANCINYFCHYPDHFKIPLTTDVLYHLTDQQLLPRIDAQFGAPVFLLAESQLRSDIELWGGNAMARHVSLLEKRCIASIVKDWASCYRGVSSLSSSSSSISIYADPSTNIEHTSSSSSGSLLEGTTLVLRSIVPLPHSHDIKNTMTCSSSMIPKDERSSSTSADEETEDDEEGDSLFTSSDDSSFSSSSCDNTTARNEDDVIQDQRFLDFLKKLPTGVLVDLIGATVVARSKKIKDNSALGKFPRPWTRERLPAMLLDLIQPVLRSSIPPQRQDKQ
jgi:hypothetical protein